jgi:DNA primase catalytic subunit
LWDVGIKLKGCKEDFRVASLAERKRFYYNEFKASEVKKFFVRNGMKVPQICALDAGSESGVIIDKKLKGIILYFPFKELEKKVKKYLPEDVYYDRCEYANPAQVLKTMNFRDWKEQELMFDIDSDNVKCKCSQGKGKNKEKFCCNCLQKALDEALKIEKLLRKKGFKKTFLSYSGRGFHVHVLDEKAYRMTIGERRTLVKDFMKFGIDEWVSKGFIKLARLPLSLHGLVSRKFIGVKADKTGKFDLKNSFPKRLDN